MTGRPIALIVGRGLLATSLAAKAQRAEKVYRGGCLEGSSGSAVAPFLAALGLTIPPSLLLRADHVIE